MTTFLLINNDQYVKYLLSQVISIKQIELLDYYLFTINQFNKTKQKDQIITYYHNTLNKTNKRIRLFLIYYNSIQ